MQDDEEVVAPGQEVGDQEEDDDEVSEVPVYSTGGIQSTMPAK